MARRRPGRGEVEWDVNPAERRWARCKADEGGRLRRTSGTAQGARPKSNAGDGPPPPGSWRGGVGREAGGAPVGPMQGGRGRATEAYFRYGAGSPTEVQRRRWPAAARVVARWSGT